jgi:hypothetical protein
MAPGNSVFIKLHSTTPSLSSLYMSDRRNGTVRNKKMMMKYFPFFFFLSLFLPSLFSRTIAVQLFARRRFDPVLGFALQLQELHGLVRLSIQRDVALHESFSLSPLLSLSQRKKTKNGQLN